MAVKGKKCQDVKMRWISSSFSDSFSTSMDEDSDNFNSPAGKRLKTVEKNELDDPLAIKNGFKLGSSKMKVSKSLMVWCEKYKPKSVDELVVNKKKISQVESWLKSVFLGDNCDRKSKILLLTGPTGCGKTCTLNVLCSNLKINIIEWATPMDITYEHGDNGYGDNFFVHQRSVTQLFDEFIIRASKYSSLLSLDTDVSGKKVVLVKDFPNAFLDKPEAFHQILEKYYQNSYSEYHISPIVFILSCPNITRELFSDELKHQYNVTNINFNPVTEMSIVKALNQILLLESKNCSSKFKMPSKEDLINISDCSDGDLRSAVLKLQFNLDNSGNSVPNNGFKIPTSVSNYNLQRIKVKKSVSVKQRVCEIDKDKKLDFFNLIGRVLYPKKEPIESKCPSSDIKNSYKFVHSPDSIVDSFLVEPNKFINMLHENYLDRFTDIKDVSAAAASLSLNDFLLSSSWQGRDVLVQYSLSAVVRCLMTSNSSPAPNSWRPLSKSKIWSTEHKRKENLMAIRRIFPDMQSEKDILVDVIPFLKRLNINLTTEQDEIISRVARYKP